jgi:murein DD-endopeptidase MepM/ murein hydrolase activator NlpD
MKRIFIILFISVLVIALVVFRLNKKRATSPDQQQNLPEAAETDKNQAVPNNARINQNNSLAFPIDRANERVAKKPFGIYITSQNSPIQPERFSGYHTGTDFETFPDEKNSDIPIYAITSGKIVLEKWASGYGGVLVESAEINGSPATIIYGHLNLESINKKTGENLNAGEQIGILGKGYSQETDGERKHLHLGIHKGTPIDIRGYVSSKGYLSDWIDFMNLIPNF